MKIRKNDLVEVIAGKDKGKRGRVERVIPKHQRAVVKGVNLVKRHLRPTPTLRQAGIVQQEMPIHLSNLMVVCSRCNRPVRIGFRFLEDGRKARYCKKCNEVID